jgi:TonB-linked SusC/RagA family outer membrane protein
MRLLHQRLVTTSLLAYLLAIIFFPLSPAFSQTTRVFRGTVTDEKGTPLEGASVTLRGSTQGVPTKADGSFSISAPEGSAVTITSVGRAPKEVVLRGAAPVRVQLETTASTLNDVVVVGYGTVRKKDLTGSVAVVNVNDAKKNATYDVARMLQGQAAGISVHGSGEPGGFVQIKIRGTSTFGNNSPLFVIDGVPVEAPYDFSPNDIESIQVLKDASAAAIYGSRAATGVIIITTKKGRSGPPRVNFSSYIGAQNIAKRIPVLNREQYQKVVSAAELNAGLTIAPGNDPASPQYITNINTDWQKEALKTGVIQDHNVNLSGGSEFVTYSLSLGYFNQTGTQTGPQKYDRYTLNSGVQGKKGRFSFGGKFAYTQSHKGNYGATNGHAVFGGTVTSMLTAIPTMPVYDPARLGGYGGSDAVKNRAISANVVGINNLVNDYSDRNRMLANTWGELEIAKNLKYRLNVSYDRTDFKNFHFEPKFDMGYYYLNDKYYMYEQLGKASTGLIENTLTYQLQAGKHKIDFLGGMTYQEDHGEWIAATATDTADLNFQTFGAVANASAKGVTSYKDASAIFSLLGRVNYNYADRYLVTLNFRRDGSSRFGPANRYGNFPGVAAAWNIGNEQFLRLPHVVSSLKLRAGYGQLGNQNFGNYLFQAYINNAANYVFNNILAPGATNVSVADPNIKWESTTTSNVAMDLGLLNEKLTVTAEYFYRKSADVITAIPIPYSVGSFPQTITTNAATLQNSGVELTVGYRGNIGAFKYNINANAYTLKNKVLKLGGANSPIYGAGSKTEVGREIGALYGLKTAGLFSDTADVRKSATQNQAGGVEPGDVKFVDTNGDGAITDADRVYLGSSIPKFYYGFNFDASYKNFDFSFFLQGNAGNKVFNGVYQAVMAGQYGNSHTDILNYWTPSNTNTNVPRPLIGDINNGRFSDRFVQSGSYLRLQNAQIGYSLGKRLIFNSFRIYVSGQNLLTITKYKGYDPDFISNGTFDRGFDYGSFPNPRTVIVGLQMGL